MIIKRGQLKIGAEIIFNDIVFHITAKPGSQQSLGYWNGHFEIPADGDAGFVKIYQEHAPLTIILDDGRTGQCNWKDMDGMGAHATVYFVGTGPLK